MKSFNSHTQDTMNDITIAILGSSGAGKTTFFFSLFKKLALVGKNNFFLKTEDLGRQKYLIDLYERLANKGEWPAGTRKISDWIFYCYVQNSDQENLKACELKLFDYRGGVLTDQAEQEDEEDLIEAIKQSDAVLGILDGQKVLAFMQDRDLMDKDVMRWMQKDLSNLLQEIQDFDNSGKSPVHFIISKWDVLENAHYSLNEIKQRLFEKVPALEHLINRRDQANSPVYLIPVSAVGQGFARLRNGMMKKNPGTIPYPFGVEVPLALTLTDLQKDVVSTNKRLTSSRLKIFVYFAVSLVISACLKIWVLILGIYILFCLLFRSKNKNIQTNNSKASAQIISSEAPFHKLLDKSRQIREEFISRYLEVIYTEIKRRTDNNKVSVQAIASKSAFQQLLNECHQIRKEFLNQYPEAICTEIPRGVQP